MSERLYCEAISRAELGPPIKKAGSELLYRCVNHHDEHPSLAVNPQKNCWMCGPCGASGNAWELAAFLSRLQPDDKAGIAAWLRQKGLLSGDSSKDRIEAVYNYTDEAGTLLFQTVRYTPKDFRQRRPDGNGGWVWNLEGVRRVLYRLPEVLESKYTLILEGEKDCETARNLGLVATCNPCGAGKWSADYSECLRDKRVVIIGDNDEPGRKHAREVARSLVGVAAMVKLIEALSNSKDLSVWVEKGGTRDSLLEIIKQAPEVKAEDLKAWGVTNHAPRDRFNLTLLGDLMKEPDEAVSWLLDGILPSGGLSLLAAKPKTGKSTLARCLALAVARGEEFLGRATLQGPVIYLALEEKRSEVKKHFADLGADGTEPIHIHCAAAPQDAIPALLEEVKRLKPVLVIVDPILRMTRIRDANDYALVSNALEPLMSLAREYGAHLLLVYHLGKGERADATDAILGSTAFLAAVDTALIMQRTEKYRTLQSSQRYGEDLPETTTEFDRERRAVSLGTERSQADALAVSEEILKFLKGAGEGKTEPEINESVEASTAAKRKAIRQLVADGKVERSGSGVRGEPFIYRFLFSCPTYIPGTRVQETEKAADTSINIDSNLVPALEQKPFLVPENNQGKKVPLIMDQEPSESEPWETEL
jgi:5S rRNA maturation endonuclease (ribonuclease M5)